MKHVAQTNQKILAITIVSVLVLIAGQGILTGCAATDGLKRSGVYSSQAATDQWHSFEILPDHNYYCYGPDARPFFIIAIDKQYNLTSKLWRPVDLTPERLKKWIDIPPRVGYDPRTYGADIAGPNGERIGLWYSVRDWRDKGSATLGENNQVAVTTPLRMEEQQHRRTISTSGILDF